MYTYFIGSDGVTIDKVLHYNRTSGAHPLIIVVISAAIRVHLNMDSKLYSHYLN